MTVKKTPVTTGGCKHLNNRRSRRFPIDNLMVRLYLQFICRALKTWWKERKEPKDKKLPQYEQDYNLEALEEHFMFWEYLEIGNLHSFVFHTFEIKFDRIYPFILISHRISIYPFSYILEL